ncbi:MAG: type II and III secretion system protein family protein, partial [Nevskia sp.]
IPVLGAFFRTTSINRTEKELIMIITPHLVRPMSRGTQTPALPGASLDNYRPNFAETMFLETGDFGQDAATGYSK